MLGWAVTFLIIALIAAVLGFGGIAGFAVELAKIVFVVAIVLFVISAIFGFVRGRSPTIRRGLSGPIKLYSGAENVAAQHQAG